MGALRINALKRLSQVFQSSEEVPFDDSSKIVLMSDCHRGDGSFADNFSRNQNLYFAALTHYYNQKYTYIEIGDGDELWENNKLSDIIRTHSDAFWLLSKFYNEGRLYFIYGNHDIVKRNKRFVENNMYRYFSERMKKYIPLFENIKVHEGLVLRYMAADDRIFLVHGHQGDWLNDRLWRLGRFFASFIWKPLELFGINDLTSTAKNYHRKQAVEKRLTDWVIRKRHMLIAGHTHRPVFPEAGEPPYFNDGSCVHPRCITAIEIAFGFVRLVKWCVKTKNDGTLFVGRDVLAGPEKLINYFKTRQ